MSAAHVRIEALRLETRAAAFDKDGHAIALFISRASDAASHPQLGAVHAARVVSVAKDQGGAFVKLDAGPEAFLRLADDAKLNEGARIDVKVAAEARQDKLARVEMAAGAADGSYLERWIAALPGKPQREEAKPGDAVISGAFEEALSPGVPLPGGGKLHIQATRALTAADVDSSGRPDKSGPAARAQALNLAAAKELARQAALRRLGGLIVLDCVAPVSKAGGEAVRDAFVTAFSSMARRQTKVLAPSLLGLMEASLEWSETPIGERWHGANAQPTDETLAYEGLRELERQASTAPMKRFTLALPEGAAGWLKRARLEAEARLAEAYGARLTIRSHAKTRAEVFEG